MKLRLLSIATLLTASAGAFAISHPTGTVPEPSTLALFAASAIALALIAKIKK